MPFKCFDCNKVFDSKTDQCKPECTLKEVALIHYLSPNATGQQRGTRVRVGYQGKKQIEPVETKLELRVACESTNFREQATFYQPIVTCKTCLEFISKEEVNTTQAVLDSTIPKN